MKKILALVAALTLSVVALGAQAQKPAGGKMGKIPPAMSAKAGGTPAASKGVTGTSKGTVKSAPTGNTFVLTTAKGDQTVDISKASVRNGSGQFAKKDKITAGAPAEATGQWRGKTLFASSVTLTALKADKPKMGAGDAKSKMGGDKMGGGKMAPHKLPK